MTRQEQQIIDSLNIAEAGLIQHWQRGGELMAASALGELEAMVSSFARAYLSQAQQAQVERILKLVTRCTYPLDADTVEIVD